METPREIDSAHNSNINNDDNNDNNDIVNLENIDNYLDKISNIQKKPNENVGDMIFAKSVTYNIGEGDNTININELGGNNLNPQKLEVKKSRTCKETDNSSRVNSNFILYYNKNRLETVLETVNEVSNSKIDSSNISDKIKNDNNNNNKNLISDVNIDNINLKEINIDNRKNIINREYKNHDSENRINDSENNTISALITAAANNTKKSLYFLKSEKTD